MKDVSVIIVNYNTKGLVSDCLDSIFSKTVGLDFEVIVVDNASTDGSRELFQADGRIGYVYNETNLGFGRANNRGLEHVSGRNVLFLNSDTLIRGNAIKTLSDYLDSHPEAGACGANLFTREGRPNQSYMPFRPGIRAELMRFFEMKPEVFNNSGRAKPVGFISGADLMVRKAVLDEVGAFDERFFLFFEETELCARISAAGYRIVSVPEAEIVHFGGASVKSEEKEKIYQASRKLYLSLTHSAFAAKVADAIWAATVYSRILLTSGCREKREKWLKRREML